MDLQLIYLLFASTEQWRRPKAIKNILLGRRTVSNLYWGLQYGMSTYYGALHGFDLDDEAQAVQKLQAQNLIALNEADQIRLTARGQEKQHQILEQLPGLNALAWAARFDMNRFANRFNLAVQIVSEFSYGNNHYYPQTINMADSQFIKRWFISNKGSALIRSFHQLLFDFLTALNSDRSATIFIRNLVGHQIAGQTNAQLAKEYQTSADVIHLTLIILYAKLSSRLATSEVTALSSLLQGLRRPQMTVSAQKTCQLYNRFPDWSVSEIAKYRHIKQTTVSEHLLEAAIVLPVEQVPFSKLLSSATARRLSAIAPENIAEWAYKSALEAIPDLSFFEFRLFQIKQARFSNRTKKLEGRG